MSDARSPDVGDYLDEVNQTVAAIRPLLAGRPPMVQAAILADLVAMHLAGFQDESLHAPLLAGLISTVRKLIPINAVIIRERQNKPH